jgi:hypothetical protein
MVNAGAVSDSSKPKAPSVIPAVSPSVPPSLFHTLPPAPGEPRLTVPAPGDAPVQITEGMAQELLVPAAPGPPSTMEAPPSPETIAVSAGKDRESLLERLRARARKMTRERVDELLRSCD